MIYHFYDMNSGGYPKTDYRDIFIVAADEDTAITEFTRIFGHYPDNVTCECCGEDYVVYACDTWDEATRYWRESETQESFLARPDVLIHEVKEVSDG